MPEEASCRLPHEAWPLARVLSMCLRRWAILGHSLSHAAGRRQASLGTPVPRTPTVSMTTITEEDSHQSSSMARQVFPEDNPSVTVPVSEANASKEIPAAADDERQEERVATPPTNQAENVLEENVSMPDPPATQVEVENIEAATSPTNDVVMTDANVAPQVNTVNEANAAPATNV